MKKGLLILFTVLCCILISEQMLGRDGNLFTALGKGIGEAVVLTLIAWLILAAWKWLITRG